MLIRSLLTAALCLLVLPAQGESSIIINEFLADPASGLAGDANHDGTRDTSDDEFVEIYNTGDGAVDLTAWLLGDGTKTRHVFPEGTLLAPAQALVVFGGGEPHLDGIFWQTSSTGSLSLNNSGDTISLLDGSALVDKVVYGSEANDNQSLTRNPEGEGGAFVPHTGLEGADGRLFSPGYLVNPVQIVLPPEPPEDPQTAAVPEPLTALTLALGLAAAGMARVGPR